MTKSIRVGLATLLVISLSLSIAGCASNTETNEASIGKPGGTSVQTREKYIADPATFAGFRYPFSMMRW